MNKQQELSEGQLKAVDVIIKLLNLAAGAGTPAEAAAATAKAQQLLEQHNLDSSIVTGAAAVKEGRREEAMVEGGFYAFQRELWKEVAELNFCVYWNQKYQSQEVWNGRLVMKRRHALVGRIVNTRMTVAMATYLQDAIERLTREKILSNEERLSNWAFSFRKGACATIVEKLKDRRAERLEAERRALREAAVAAEGAGHSTGRGLTLAAFSKSEKEANDDFKFGEGYSARKAQERAERADMNRRMEAAYTQWAKENPKAARSRFKFKDEKSGKTWVYGTDRSRGGPGSMGGSDGIDRSAYRAGREAAEAIGLDPQAEAAKVAGVLK
jgi:hypothetical protein